MRTRARPRRRTPPSSGRARSAARSPGGAARRGRAERRSRATRIRRREHRECHDRKQHGVALATRRVVALIRAACRRRMTRSSRVNAERGREGGLMDVAGCAPFDCRELTFDRCRELWFRRAPAQVPGGQSCSADRLSMPIRAEWMPCCSAGPTRASSAASSADDVQPLRVDVERGEEAARVRAASTRLPRTTTPPTPAGRRRERYESAPGACLRSHLLTSSAAGPEL